LEAAEVAREAEERERDRRLGHRDVDEATLAGAASVLERGEDADRAEEAAADVGDLHARRLRGAADGAREPEHAAARNVVEIVARAILERAVLAVARDGAVDEARVVLLERLIAEAEALHHAGTVALDEHVVLGDELEERGAPGLALEVEDDAALAPVEPVEHRAHPVVRERVGGARAVAEAGVFELVDLGAQVAEDHRAEGGGEEAREIEDLDPLERAVFVLVHRRLNWRAMGGGRRSGD